MTKTVVNYYLLNPFLEIVKYVTIQTKTNPFRVVGVHYTENNPPFIPSVVNNEGLKTFSIEKARKLFDFQQGKLEKIAQK